MVQCMASVCILAALTITTSHCPQWRIKIWAHNIHKTAAMVRTYNQTSKALLIMARNFNLTPWILKWSWHSNGNGGSGLLLHSCSRCPLLAIFSSYLLFGDSQFAKFASSWRPGSPVNSSLLWRQETPGYSRDLQEARLRRSWVRPQECVVQWTQSLVSETRDMDTGGKILQLYIALQISNIYPKINTKNIYQANIILSTESECGGLFARVGVRVILLILTAITCRRPRLPAPARPARPPAQQGAGENGHQALISSN